ncbi:gp80 [Beggiatoa sp. PS]|nr:gp80 [Beggiatoa sp. PS]
MNVQFIEKQGKPEWAVIPYEMYQSFIENSEMLQDIEDYDKAKQLIEAGEPLIPAEVTFQIIDGENPIKVWRQYYHKNIEQFATETGLNKDELLQIESDLSLATKEQLAIIAKTLNLSVDDIVI